MDPFSFVRPCSLVVTTAHLGPPSNKLQSSLANSIFFPCALFLRLSFEYMVPPCNEGVDHHKGVKQRKADLKPINTGTKDEKPKYPHLFPPRSVIPISVSNQLVMNIDVVVNFSIASHRFVGFVGPHALEFFLLLIMYFARNVSSGFRIEVIISE